MKIAMPEEVRYDGSHEKRGLAGARWPFAGFGRPISKPNLVERLHRAFST